ncbi:MAG: acetyl-CoA C-acyltransferase, partial [Candidatus Accumulibacter sp.]|uniref:acetyl-CoA C-acyltransferase n=1 Tax=Accumulibacter sp. TaxID=2053492 RepID=UPI001A4389C9
MSKQIQDAYIVAATRLPVGRRKGMLGHVRPDDMLAHAIRSVMAQAPGLDPVLVEDVIVGCAMPEAEQGMNVARIGLLLAGLPNTVPGVTVNRFCASGVQTVAMAADRIRLGEADVMIAGGTETMSLMNQMMGNKIALNPVIFEKEENYAIGFGMGITAEKVAAQWKISREDQDAFAVASHQKACAAIDAGHFRAEISPYAVQARLPNLRSGAVTVKEYLAENDEGPRRDSSVEGLARLRPVFAARGSVTAGNSSQMSDGAAAVLLVSEKILKQFNLTPLARFAGFAVAGVAPEIMGIGPVEAIPRVLRQTGVRQDEVDWFELNEAFAAQALAVIRTLELDPAKVNPLGGAIALGHPLGATGAIRTATLVHGLQRSRQRYGMVTMCIG